MPKMPMNDAACWPDPSGRSVHAGTHEPVHTRIALAGGSGAGGPNRRPFLPRRRALQFVPTHCVEAEAAPTTFWSSYRNGLQAVVEVFVLTSTDVADVEWISETRIKTQPVTFRGVSVLAGREGPSRVHILIPGNSQRLLGDLSIRQGRRHRRVRSASSRELSAFQAPVRINVSRSRRKVSRDRGKW